jgi:hypothetical protein
MSDNAPAYAITIRPPWPALIIAGRKRIECRTWATRHRGRLWIHAGVRDDPEADPALFIRPVIRGAVIGYVTLTGITGTEGDWRWHLADPVALARPVSCRGRLGLWRFPGGS